jgi:hypothetical protein
VQITKYLGAADGVRQNWIERAYVSMEKGTVRSLNTSGKGRIATLRRDNKQLRTEREFQMDHCFLHDIPHLRILFG